LSSAGRFLSYPRDLLPDYIPWNWHAGRTKYRPFPADQARKRIEDSWPAKLSRSSPSFSAEATGHLHRLAQVHGRAAWMDGTEVVESKVIVRVIGEVIGQDISGCSWRASLERQRSKVAGLRSGRGGA